MSTPLANLRITRQSVHHNIAHMETVISVNVDRILDTACYYKATQRNEDLEKLCRSHVHLFTGDVFKFNQRPISGYCLYMFTNRMAGNPKNQVAAWSMLVAEKKAVFSTRANKLTTLRDLISSTLHIVPESADDEESVSESEEEVFMPVRRARERLRGEVDVRRSRRLTRAKSLGRLRDRSRSRSPLQRSRRARSQCPQDTNHMQHDETLDVLQLRGRTLVRPARPLLCQRKASRADSESPVPRMQLKMKKQSSNSLPDFSDGLTDAAEKQIPQVLGSVAQSPEPAAEVVGDIQETPESTEEGEIEIICQEGSFGSDVEPDIGMKPSIRENVFAPEEFAASDVGALSFDLCLPEDKMNLFYQCIASLGKHKNFNYLVKGIYHCNAPNKPSTRGLPSHHRTRPVVTSRTCGTQTTFDENVETRSKLATGATIKLGTAVTIKWSAKICQSLVESESSYSKEATTIEFSPDNDFGGTVLKKLQDALKKASGFQTIGVDHNYSFSKKSDGHAFVSANIDLKCAEDMVDTSDPDDDCPAPNFPPLPNPKSPVREGSLTPPDLQADLPDIQSEVTVDTLDGTTLDLEDSIFKVTPARSSVEPPTCIEVCLDDDDFVDCEPMIDELLGMSDLSKIFF